MKTLMKIMLLSLLVSTAFAAPEMSAKKSAPKYAEKHDNKGIEDATYCESRRAAESLAKIMSKKGKGKKSI